MNMDFKESSALLEKSHQDQTCVSVELNQAFSFALLSRITLRDGPFRGI